MSEKCFWCEGRETLVLAARGRSPERVVKCLCSVIPENRRLREALEWYADNENYREEYSHGLLDDHAKVWYDKGSIARAALTPPPSTAKETP